MPYDKETRDALQAYYETHDFTGSIPAFDDKKYTPAQLHIYRGFLMDNILHSDVGDIHFHLYIPESYDGSEPYALYISLPGYEGLYFQGVGKNIRSEDFVFEAQKYNDKMIIAAPQLSDWGQHLGGADHRADGISARRLRH